MILFAHTPDLKAPAKMILVLLSGYGDSKGQNIYPSLSTIAKLSGMSTRSAQDNIDKLVKLGYVKKKSGGYCQDTGQNMTSRYMIDLERLGVGLPENVVKLDFEPREEAEEIPVRGNTRFMPKDVAERLSQ
ncbi:helix-turn-helix domain-containing protein [Vibrio parahaemolyticus]